MVSLKSIEEFIAHKQIAVAGASRNSKKFGYILVRELTKKGITVYPVNPLADEILGIKCYHDIESLPSHVKAIIFVTKPEVTEKLVPEAIKKDIKQLWMQKGAESINAIDYARLNKANVIFNHCILMFIKPSAWVHNAHRFIKKLSGSYPR